MLEPTVHSAAAYPGMSHHCYFLPSVPLTLSLQLQQTDTELWLEKSEQ